MAQSNFAFRGVDLVQRGVQLRHFRLIALLQDTKQLSAAAAAMKISQPAASRLAMELERITGVKLYTRHPRGVELTDHGERLAKRALLILHSIGDASREMTELTTGEAGNVNLGAVTGPAIELVLPILKRMRVGHSNVETSVIVEISEVMAQELLAHRLDFYLGRIPAHVDLNLFDARAIGIEPATLIVRQEHPLTKHPEISLSDCVQYDWVMQMHGGLLRRTAEDYLQVRGLPLPNIVLSTSSILLTLATIRETNAIAPVGRSVAEFFGEDSGAIGGIRSLPIAPDLAVPTYSIVKLKDSILSPAAQVFYDYLVGHSSEADA